MEQPLTAVIGARPLHDVALVDQLLEHAAEGLLGDLENIKELRDLHSGIAIDEMQYAVMSAAKSELLERIVRVTDEISIGKEQEFNEIPQRLVGGRRGGRRGWLTIGPQWGS